MTTIIKSKIFISAVFLVLLCVFLGLAIVPSQDKPESSSTESGACGDSAKWEYYKNTGKLKISGDGEISNYASSRIPWRSYRSDIKSVIIADKITSIGKNAFYKCSSLTSVVIPSNVVTIGDKAFSDCKALISVVLRSDTPVSLGSKVFSKTDIEAIYVPEKVLDAYRSHADWEKYKDIIFSIEDLDTSDIKYGDVNGDEKVSSSDILQLRKYLSNYDYQTGTSTIAVCAGADVNGDGEITSSDVLVLRRYVANYDYATGESSVVLGPQS